MENKESEKQIIDYYKSKFKKHGYSPKSLGWDKGKQDLRFFSLTNRFDLQKFSILDIGCGFGDLNAYFVKNDISNYEYLGIDIVDDFIEEASKRYGSSNAQFVNESIFEYEFNKNYDYVVSSGIFNHKLIEKHDGGGYGFIREVMSRAIKNCNIAISFDFLSDKVDYQLDHTFHSSPEKILEMAYSFSRNIVLDNSFFPFEFCVTIYKDDSFKKEDTIFNIIKNSII